VKTHLLVVRVWVLRNPTKSVAFPKPPRGDAEVSGRETGPATADGTLYRPTEPVASNIGGRRATVAPKFGPM
jgi:hypothetical protein